jgi:isoleucyl-tRNA synthetase
MKQSGADILRLWVMTTDYWEDQRLGKNVLQTNVDAYRKLRNTIRWMLGTLAHDEGEAVDFADMPELERLMLHRLAELDEIVRKGYDNFDFKRIARALIDFMVVDLSAFYFDIRKDALYCDAPSSARRKAAIVVVRHLFDNLVTWLAPMLPFTMEEAWLERYPRRGRCISRSSARFRPNGATTRLPRAGARCARCAASSPARWRSSVQRKRSARRWRPRRSSTSRTRRSWRRSPIATWPRSASPAT